MASCLLSQELPDKAREVMVKGLSIWLPSCREKGEGQVGGASASVGPEDEVSNFVVVFYVHCQYSSYYIII